MALRLLPVLLCFLVVAITPMMAEDNSFDEFVSSVRNIELFQIRYFF